MLQSDKLKVYTVELTEVDLHWINCLLFQAIGIVDLRKANDNQKEWMKLINKLYKSQGKEPFGEEYL